MSQLLDPNQPQNDDTLPESVGQPLIVQQPVNQMPDFEDLIEEQGGVGRF